MEGSIERSRIAINAMRARLTILGFNLVIITFQISNTRGLGGGIHLEGFEKTVHLSTGTVLLTGVALSIASMVAFITSNVLDKEGTCDHRMMLAGDLLMYLALAQTVVGFFSSYERVIETLSMPTVAEQEALSAIRIGISVFGSIAWFLAIYVGPIVSLVRSSHSWITKAFHAAGYFGVLVCVSHLWWAAQWIERRTLARGNSPSAWLNAFAAPLFW